MPPLVRVFLDADPPLVIGEVRQGGDFMGVMSDPSGPLEQVDLVDESMVVTELLDVRKHLRLGQVGEDAQ